MPVLPLAVLVFAAGAAAGTAGGHAVPVGAALVAIGAVWALGFGLGAIALGWRAWLWAAIGLGIAGAGIALAAGCWWAAARMPRPLAGDLVHMAPMRLARVLLRVDTDPVWTGDRWIFEARAVQALFPRSRQATGRVAVTWRIAAAERAPPATRGAPADPATLADRPRIGDLVLVAGRLKRIDPPANPGQPDYAAWAARRGLFSRLWATHLAVAAPGDAPWNLVRLAGDVRERSVAIIGRGLGPREAALAGSLLFGAGAVPVEAQTRQTFTDLGLAHVLAASGMQTTLLVGLALGLGRAAGLPVVPRCAAAIGLATFFAAMCGFAPSIMRATWMSGAALLAEATGRQAIGTRTLWLSALALLVSAPSLVLDIGFQFSFLATYGLLTTGTGLRCWLHGAIAAHEPLRARWARAEAEARRGPPLGGSGAGDRGPFGGGASDRGPGWLGVLADGFSVPVAAFVWCTPLQLVHFGRLSPWSLPANWYAEGFVTLLTYAGFLLAGAGLIWDRLAIPVPWILGPLLGTMLGGLDLIHRLPGSALAIQAPPAWTAGIAYALLALPRLLRPRTAAPRVAAVAPLVLAAGVLAAGSAAAHAPPGKLEVTVLAVGQGDAIVVRSPGGACGLVDAGPGADGWDAGRAIVVPALRHLGCRQLDLAVVTHPHADHVGGMTSVLAAVPVQEVWDAGQPDETPGYNGFLATVLGTGTRLSVPVPGDRRLMQGVEWQVLGPTRPLQGGTRSDPNNNSVVVRLTYGASRILLAGDLEADGERALLARIPAHELRADLLKAPHHGSRFGTTPRFLAAVRPKASVVSAGRENRFGHPDPATLARLAAFGPVYRTDRDGAITIHVEPATWTVSPWSMRSGEVK